MSTKTLYNFVTAHSLITHSSIKVQDGDAHSYYNPLEAETLVDLVSGLLDQQRFVDRSNLNHISIEDIGVICTYRKQVSNEMIYYLGCMHYDDYYAFVGQ
jgi:hypothetical protein